MVKKVNVPIIQHILVQKLFLEINQDRLMHTVCSNVLMYILIVFLGCPFKHIDPELLAQKLDKLDLDINSDQISKVHII